MFCPLCHTAFDCTKDTSCWCFQFPNFLAVNDTSSCLCKHCLAIQFQQSVDLSILQHGLQATLAIAKQDSNTNQWLEYIDYTVENGNTVFTKWAHLKRGECCGNGCKNCPY